MEVYISINGVLRNLIQKFDYHYNYHFLETDPDPDLPEQTIPFEYYKQIGRLIDKLRGEKVQIIALEQDKKAISYLKFKPRFPLALIVGNEVKGVSKKILQKSDKIIYLPMSGQKESLNVSVAFGVAGYEINKSRN